MIIRVELAIVIVSAPVVVALAESVAWSEKWNVPAEVGVPFNRPVALRTSPEGSVEPLATAQL